jgi:hypothetical protein
MNARPRHTTRVSFLTKQLLFLFMKGRFTSNALLHCHLRKNNLSRGYSHICKTRLHTRISPDDNENSKEMITKQILTRIEQFGQK